MRLWFYSRFSLQLTIISWISQKLRSECRLVVILPHGRVERQKPWDVGFCVRPHVSSITIPSYSLGPGQACSGCSQFIPADPSPLGLPRAITKGSFLHSLRSSFSKRLQGRGFPSPKTVAPPTFLSPNKAGRIIFSCPDIMYLRDGLFSVIGEFNGLLQLLYVRQGPAHSRSLINSDWINICLTTTSDE